MTSEEISGSLTNLMRVLYDNLGNRLSVSLMNGISVTHKEFLDTLLVAQVAEEAQNTAIEGAQTPEE